MRAPLATAMRGGLHTGLSQDLFPVTAVGRGVPATPGRHVVREGLGREGDGLCTAAPDQVTQVTAGCALRTLRPSGAFSPCAPVPQLTPPDSVLAGGVSSVTLLVDAGEADSVHSEGARGWSVAWGPLAECRRTV